MMIAISVFSSLAKEKKYGPRHLKTPLLKRDRGFLLGENRSCSIMAILGIERYRANWNIARPDGDANWLMEADKSDGNED